MPIKQYLMVATACCWALLAANSGCAKPEDQPIADTPPAPLAIPPIRKETQRSQQLAKHLQTTDKETQVIWLGSGKEEFLGLYRPDSSGRPLANIVILHDNLQHPDWPGIIRQLRLKLSSTGWNTLSIALPDYLPKPAKEKTDSPVPDPQSEELDTEATEPPDMMPSAMPDDSKGAIKETPLMDTKVEYESEKVPAIMNERISLAISFIKEKSPLPVVVLCHGLSATLIAKQAQTMLVKDISGLVIIDPVEVTALKGFDSKLDAMDLRIPVLDIAPEFNPRTAPALRKKNAARLQHKGYRQQVIHGADQDFSNTEAALIKTVRGWGEKLFRNAL